MDKVYERIYWVNEDVSQTTPLGATNLNKTDYAINEIDDRVISLDLTKAKESDVLTMLADVSYNPTTGVFTFTKKNGQTIQADINIEKIPVSFSMDDKGIITMETSDGSKYTADVGSLIKTYTFEDSSTIDVTETVDAQGNKTVVASVVNGSIGEEQLDPTYYARINTAVQNAEASATSASGSANSSAASATSADNSATLAESWAIGGTGARPDEDVNNAKYWCEQAESKSGIGSGNLYIMQDGEQKGVFNANASADVTVDLSGGGASDYTELENKPQINGVTLEGNKTTDDLGIDGGAKVYTKEAWESADHSDIEDGTQIVISNDFDAMGATPITLDEWNAIEPTEANEGNQYVITDDYETPKIIDGHFYKDMTVVDGWEIYNLIDGHRIARKLWTKTGALNATFMGWNGLSDTITKFPNWATYSKVGGSRIEDTNALGAIPVAVLTENRKTLYVGIVRGNASSTSVKAIIEVFLSDY